jgi:uncharacterized iron-regulated protein
VIAKITRGSRRRQCGVYPWAGKANEHQFKRGHAIEQGAVVIGGNLGREGATQGTRWAQELRAAADTRDQITKPIWQVSLRSAPGDRRESCFRRHTLKK